MTGFKLIEEQLLRWHNLLKKPNDLPRNPDEYEYDEYLCIIAKSEDIAGRDRVNGFTLTSCLYYFNDRKWYICTPEKHEPVADRVVAWADPMTDFMSEAMAQ